MSLSLHIYVLIIIEKSTYCIQKVFEVDYPRTSNQLETGGIHKLLNGLNFVQVND
jgi:hypothetical protein